MKEQHIILGGPGCGKTTYLLDLVEQELNRGIKTQEILFCSFTKKATNEAIERLETKLNLSKKELPYFKTLHALAFMQMNLKPSQILGKDHYTELGKLLNLKFSNSTDESGFMLGNLSGDRIAFQEQMLRVTKQNILSTPTPNYWTIRKYSDTLQSYKKDNVLLDHTDIMSEYASKGEYPSVKVVIVDEAQDLSPVQWDVVEKIINKNSVLRVYIAGDDDQAIYTWAGADIKHFLSLEGNKTILPKSHRLSNRVFNQANAISSKIKVRYNKDWSSREEKGSVVRISNPSNVQITPNETWLFLARSNYMLDQFKKVLKDQSILYSHKNESSVDSEVKQSIIDYGRLKENLNISRSAAHNLLKKLSKDFKHIQVSQKEHYSLDDLCLPNTDWYNIFDVHNQSYYRKISNIFEDPLVKLSTIHSVKGGEADNVVVVTDIPPSTHREMLDNINDDEHRVFYVAATRARNNLFILNPKTVHFYRMPI